MSDRKPKCRPGEHASPLQALPPAALDRAAQLFRAMGDAPRLRLLELLQSGELCVTEIVATVGEKFPTVSQRLRLLRGEGLIRRRRDGNHIYYAIADQHVADLIRNALDHARELEARQGKPSMTETINMAHIHDHHDHQHGSNCGHTAIQHDGHTDYLHDGHLHHVTAAGIEEHQVPVSNSNPADCTPSHDCGGHELGHVHGAGCGHEPVPHGDHVDYLVNGHLHHPHGDHCDDHGAVQVV